MNESVDGKEVKMVTTVELLDGGAVISKDESVEVIAKGKYTGPTCEVSYSSGATLNMGNYQSARVDVRVSVPCYSHEIQPVYAWVEKFVEAKAQEVVNSVNN
jgi:hypothetical protein